MINKRAVSILLAGLLLMGCEDKKPTPIDIDGEIKSDPVLKGDPKLIKVPNKPIWMYRNVGGNLSNITVVEGRDGLIIIDTGLTLDDATSVAKDLNTKFTKKIKAIIYTHHHIDHVGGGAAFLPLAADDLEIIGSDHLNTEMQDENNVVGKIMALRAYYMYGTALYDQEDTDHFRIGLTGKVVPGKTAFLPTTQTINKETTITIAGEKLTIFPTGGEAASHIGIYMPDIKTVFTGDELQGPTFPNLHSLRGTKPRDANNWITALDRIRAFKPEILVPGHGDVINGADDIENILRIYRDAIQWTHDQAVRLINKGYTQEELAEALPHLPKDLQLYPYTSEFYGTIKHSVRNYFTGYISWFSGDATDLNPTPRVERSRRYVALMGGANKVITEAKQAKENNDPQWVAELTTHLIRIDHDNLEARALKAWAFRALARKTENTNWQGFYLTGAMELEGSVNSLDFQKDILKKFTPKYIDSYRLLSMMRYIVDSEKAEGKDEILTFSFPDKGEKFTLHLRNHILDVQSGSSDQSTATLTMNRTLFDQILMGQKSFAKEIAIGDISISGSRLDALSLLSVLDADPVAINLVIR